MYAPSLAPKPMPRCSQIAAGNGTAAGDSHPGGWRDSIIEPGVRTRTDVEGVWMIAGTPRAAGRRWFWTDTIVALVNGVDTKLGEILVTAVPERETATSRSLDGQCRPGRDVKWIVRTSGFANAGSSRA